MAAGNSNTLIQAERELQESRIKHRTLINEYFRLVGLEQNDNGSLDAHTLQVLLKNNRRIMAQQRRTYEIKSRCSAFLQNAQDIKDTYKTVKECVRQAKGLKMPKTKAYRNMFKKLLKNKVSLEGSSDNIQELSDLLEELSVDECVSDTEEDLALQKELADHRDELLKTLPPIPVGLDSTVSSLTGHFRHESGEGQKSKKD